MPLYLLYLMEGRGTREAHLLADETTLVNSNKKATLQFCETVDV